MDLEIPFPDGAKDFVPPCCPYAGCPARTLTSPFRWQHRGHFRRRCDGQAVPRFLCLTCKRSFSRQTFRIDYRLRRPALTFAIFDALVSKVTHRQAARVAGCNRKAVPHRLRLLADHSRQFHEAVLARSKARGGLPGSFQFDELETYEHSRRLKPVTMPVLIEHRARFVVHLETASLPARGNLSPRDYARKCEIEQEEGGPRISGSREAVKKCIAVLADVLPKAAHVVISSDRKSSYRTVVAETILQPCTHARHPGTAERSSANPLFPINHTLMMLRDGVSRLVRRTWGASKMRDRLALHAWIWTAYRNYIREFTNQSRHATSGQVLGVVARKFTPDDFFEWRVLPWEFTTSEGDQYPVSDLLRVPSPTPPQSHPPPSSP